MELSFHGADRDVTGSCHLLECAGKRLLIDCGMFQGGRELNAENAAPLAGIVMQDAARMAEDDAAHAQRQGRRCGYGERLALTPDITVSYHEAGHILGSTSMLVEVGEAGRRTTPSPGARLEL